MDFLGKAKYLIGKVRSPSTTFDKQSDGEPTVLLSTLERFEKQLKELLKPGRRFDYFQCLALIQPQMERIYRFIDIYNNAWKIGLQKEISCRQGCSACCGHYVASVEPFELLFLDWQIKKRTDYSILQVEMLRRQRIFETIASREKIFNEEEALFQYYRKSLPCPFLKSTGICGIYAIRPIPCRMFFSHSHPLWCRGENTAAPENKNILVELPDEIEVALYRASLHFKPFEFSVYLFPGLLRANELFGRYAADSH